MKNVYVFRVKLVGSKHAWRTIEISGNNRLPKLYSIIQKTFDHEPCHLSELQFKNTIFLDDESLEERGDFNDFLVSLSTDKSNIKRNSPEYHSDRVRIDSIGLSLKDKMKYIYDFGEDIKHTLELIEIKNSEANNRHPIVSGGNINAKCGKCRSRQAIWWCHSCGGQFCDSCVRKTSKHCIEGHYPTLKIFHDNRASQWN